MTSESGTTDSGTTDPGTTGPARSRRLRWGVPVAVAATVAAAITVPSALASGNAAKGLAPRTPAALLSAVAGSKATAVSGTVVQTARLGLPKLPTGTVGTDPMALVSGSHTLRVWADGPDKSRLALLGQLAEYDVVRNGTSVWTYRSERNEAVHYALPAATGQTTKAAPTTVPTTPQQAADQVLAQVTPTTNVTVGDSVKVAGRPAYELVLTPHDTTSLVGSVRIAVDSATSVPLRVQVFAAKDSAVPAVDVGFTDVSFTPPPPSVFGFTAPKGAKVTESGAASTAAAPDAVPDPTPGTARAAANEPQVRGEGWTSVLVFGNVDSSALGGVDPAMLDALTRKVPGGRLLTTSLFSVLLTDDGRLLVGAVTPAVLQNTR